MHYSQWPTEYEVRKRHERYRQLGRQDAERGIAAILSADLAESFARAYWRGWRDVYPDRSTIIQVAGRMGVVPADWVLRDRD